MNILLICATCVLSDFATDPGAPAAGTAPFVFTILDDSLARAGVPENFSFQLPGAIVEGDLVLLESTSPALLAFVKSESLAGRLHPELWSDVIHFRNSPTNGLGIANILSLDTFSAGDITSTNFLYINEAFGPDDVPGKDLDGVGGFFTRYNAGISTFANTYFIESVVPEPGSLISLSVGSLSLMGYGWCRRKRAARHQDCPQLS